MKVESAVITGVVSILDALGTVSSIRPEHGGQLMDMRYRAIMG
ncbi:MAG: hypothetical protein R6U28_11365 [Cyclonatronaceae bacterium]